MGKSKRGFTLIELMIVIVIIAIMTTIAVLSIHNVDSDRFIKQQVQLLAANLDLAQQRALLELNPIGMQVLAHRLRFYRYRLSTKRWVLLRNNQLQSVKFNNNVRLQLKIAKRTQFPAVQFYPVGLVTPFSLQVLSADKTYLITVNAAGAITIRG